VSRNGWESRLCSVHSLPPKLQNLIILRAKIRKTIPGGTGTETVPVRVLRFRNSAIAQPFFELFRGPKPQKLPLDSAERTPIEKISQNFFS